MKTRSRKAGGGKKNASPTTDTTRLAQLEPSVQEPPQVFVWPRETSSAARVVTLPNPSTATPTRHLLCPEKGCFEFTRIAAPKRTCHSWLLAPDADCEGSGNESKDDGYVLQAPDLMIATPIDPLFLVLPALEPAGPDEQQMFLAPSDYLERLEERSSRLKQMLQQDDTGRLEKMLETAILSVCETMEAGDETLCKFSSTKLLERLAAKARRMVDRGLPTSMEERFVKQALAVPVMTIRRKESSVSAADVASAGAGAESDSAATSQTTERSDSTAFTTLTTATSLAPTPDPPATPTPEITHLLRLRTALNFLLASYISPSLRVVLANTPSPIDFTPLDDHLKHLVRLKQEAHALRSLSDNTSRKRSAMDDEEAIEKAEAKKRKKEEEEARKKNVTHGVKKLAKADRSGMKSISSFFGAKPAAGGKK